MSLVYSPNRWDRYQWSQFSKGDQAREVINKGRQKIFSFPDFASETFHLHYNPAPSKITNPKPENTWASNAFNELEQLPDFDRLCARTQGDKFLSGVSTQAFSEKVIDELPSPPDPLINPDPLRNQVRTLQEILKQQQLDQQDTQETQDKIKQVVAQGKQAVESAVNYARSLDPSEVRQVLRAAIESADQAVSEAENQLSTFGCSDKSSNLREMANTEEKIALFRAVKSSNKLQQIAALAGRMKRIASEKRRTKADKERSEVQGIEQGSDLARLLPSELIKLASPDLFPLFCKGFTQKSLLCYKLEGKEPQGKGPLVILLDESGSMDHSNKEIWSKTVCLALIQIAYDERRDCFLVEFSEKLGLTYEFSPQKTSFTTVLSAMERFLDGGTNYELPLGKALEKISSSSYKKADIVMISDGEARIKPSFLEGYKLAKKEKEFSCYSIMIGRERFSLDLLNSFSDKVLILKDLAEDLAIGQIFEAI